MQLLGLLGRRLDTVNLRGQLRAAFPAIYDDFENVFRPIDATDRDQYMLRLAQRQNYNIRRRSKMKRTLRQPSTEIPTSPSHNSTGSNYNLNLTSHTTTSSCHAISSDLAEPQLPVPQRLSGKIISVQRVKGPITFCRAQELYKDEAVGKEITVEDLDFAKFRRKAIAEQAFDAEKEVIIYKRRDLPPLPIRNARDWEAVLGEMLSRAFERFQFFLEPDLHIYLHRG